MTPNTRDQFISSVKGFFEKWTGAKESYWLKVPVTEIRRPPLLACREEIRQQDVHLAPLVRIIDGCEAMTFSSELFQVWTMDDGRQMALLLFHGPELWTQCLLLPGLEGFDFSFHENFHAIVQQRWQLCLAVEQVQKEIFRDDLTGLYNQRFLNITLQQKIKEYKRYNTPFTILFIDVDHFKKVNDSSGHLVGSSVLREMGALLGRSLRGTDFAFRYGGDEFIVLLCHTEPDAATIAAERLRKKIEGETFIVSGEEVQVTVSVGIAGYPEHAKSAEEIIEMADKAMYYGKSKGRNTTYKAS